jgi:hypothetical protein
VRHVDLLDHGRRALVLVVAGVLVSACGLTRGPASEPSSPGSSPAAVPSSSAASDGPWTAEQLVGLTEAAALERAAAEGYGVRMVQRDDQQFALSMDLRPNRVNLVVKDGAVAEAWLG